VSASRVIVTSKPGWGVACNGLHALTQFKPWKLAIEEGCVLTTLRRTKTFGTFTFAICSSTIWELANDSVLLLISCEATPQK
jgi:hypothetical protein